MTNNYAVSSDTNPTVFSGIAPVAVAVFLGFLAASMPLAALPLEMGSHLQASPTTIGMVIGLQSLVTVLTRHQAGTLCDQRGPRFAAMIGLPLAACSGMAYLAAGLSTVTGLSIALLLIGRILMGLGESLFLTGLMSWGIARVGAAKTGKVMSWSGIAIYAALGLGSPIGLALQSRYGFAAVSAMTVVAPVVAWLIAMRLPAVPASGGHRVPFHHVIALIWKPGLVLALATVPFAGMVSFLALAFEARGWSQAGLALFGFSAAYILVRLVAPGLPDRFGAAPVAIGCLVIEALGQALLWAAPVPGIAVTGAVLTGLGFSLIFPAMGVLATRSVPAEQRGRAVGNFIAFADIALGVTAPIVGLAVYWLGAVSPFIVGTVATGLALCVLASTRLPRAA